MKSRHKEKRRLPSPSADKLPEFTLMEYQYIEAMVVVAKFRHDKWSCGGACFCEICASINAMRSRMHGNRLQAVMMGVADRLELKHE